MKIFTIAPLAVLLATSAHAKPDLIARDLTIDGGFTYLEVDPGEDVKLKWTAQNLGSGLTGGALGSAQGIMWSTNSIISRTDTLLEKEPLGPLVSGQSSPETRTITIPSNVTPGQSYYVGIYADFNQTRSEEDETNNTSNTVIFRIKGGTPAAKPDFVATDATVNGSRYTRQVTRGETVTVKWKASNNGGGTALSQQQAVLMSTDDIISEVNDTLLGIIEAPGPFAEEETRKQTLEVTIPDDAVVGAIYYIAAYMDYGNGIGESSGTNNASDAIQVVVVSDSSPEITVKSGGDELASKGKLKFRKVEVGEKSRTQTIKIRNTGTDDLKIKKIVTTGRNKSEFKLSGAKKKKLAPGKTLRLKVTFNPKSKGRKKAAIRILSNDPDEARFDVKLTGKGK